MKKLWILFSIMIPTLGSPLYAVKGVQDEEVPEEEPFIPWFTGPLLTTSGHVIPEGYINIEPYVFAIDSNGQYDGHWHATSVPSFWTINPYVQIQMGIAPRLDFEIAPQVLWNETQGHSAFNIGDLPVGFGIQLLEDTDEDWWPGIKLTLGEQFPTGKCNHLNPRKLGTDATGTGAFTTGVQLSFGKMYHVRKKQYFNARFSAGYFYPSRVHVKGFNTYGGGYGTNGYVYPGWSLNTSLGFEYSLTRNWVLALDIQNLYTNKTRFKGAPGSQQTVETSIQNPAAGFPGVAGSGDTALGAPSADQVSLAPAIEYNFNENFGIIAGCWFTVAGRNNSRFVSGVIALNWFFSYNKALTNK